MNEQVDQSGIFPRMMDMQKEFNDRVLSMQNEYNGQIGKVYEELRKNSEQNAKVFGVLDSISASLDDLKKRLEKAEEVKHSTPCSTACGLLKEVEMQRKDLESQRRDTSDLRDTLRDIKEEQKAVYEEFKDIQKTLDKIEKEKQENKKTWKDISVHIAKYLLVLGTGGLIFLLGHGLSNYIATIKGGG